MAHMIEERDGKASFWQRLRKAGEKAWHGLGTYFSDEDAPKTAEEALIACRGNFDVEVRPQTFTCYTDDGDSYQKESTLSAAIVRTDLNTEVGTASPDYHPTQFRTIARIADPLIGEGLATIDTSAVLRNGTKFFLLLRWNLEKFSDEVREAFEGMKAYGLLTGSHSGKDSMGLYDTDVTVVCENTERMAINSAATKMLIRHSSVAELRLLEAAEKMWGSVIQSRNKVAADMMALRALTLDEIAFRAQVLDAIAPLPQEQKDFDPSARFANTLVKRAEDKRDLLTHLWTNGTGHVGNGSAWEAYQGVTEAIDHYNVLFNPRTIEARWEASVDGKMAAAKSLVFSNLLSLTK